MGRRVLDEVVNKAVPRTYRVMRGGSFYHRAGELRAAKRGYNVPWARSYAFGVRCARSAL